MRRGDRTSHGLLGRRHHRAVLGELLSRLQDGESSAVLLHGEPGIGKSALLDHVAGMAVDLRVVRTAGAESETDLSFSGLHQVCSPFIDHLAQLPTPQRDALSVALGLATGPRPDRLLVGLAVLGLLAEAAHERPVVCLVDDAQWLDATSAQALAFAARRLHREAVLLVFAMRDPIGDHPLGGLRLLEVEGLNEAEARALLSSVRWTGLDDRVRERVLAETRGNPLALLELPRDLSAEEPASSGSSTSLTDRLERGYLQRVHDLPEETQRLLLLAAADSLGDVALLHRAADLLGLDVSTAIAPARSSGLVAIGRVVRFRHPLVRSAIYRSATAEARRRAHEVLAEATDADSDAERRLWHLGRAASGPDEELAAALETAAGRTAARGGPAAAAGFLERAAVLTPEPSLRGQRLLSAAQAQHQAGEFSRALGLLDAAGLTPLGELDRARTDLVRGQVLFAARSASAGLPDLLRAARRLEELAPELALETYRDAYYAAFTAGRLPDEDVQEQIAAAVLAMPGSSRPSPQELLLKGAAHLFADGYSQGVTSIRAALAAFDGPDVAARDALGWLPLASRMAHNILDLDRYASLSTRLADLARDIGALSVLPSAQLLQVASKIFAGDFGTAEVLVDDAARLSDAMGSDFLAHYCALVLEPWRGSEPVTKRVTDVIANDVALRDEGKVVSATGWAEAVLYNGLGRYSEAFEAARRGSAHPRELGLAIWSTVELIEAAVHLGRHEDAADSVAYIVELAQACGTDWAAGVSASVRAQVSPDMAADDLFGEAVEKLEAAGALLHACRARLLWGERLRRDGHRRAARENLEIAHTSLTQMGVNAFAARAMRELEATGATIRRISSPSPSVLTPQETRIAALAAQGMTNAEIGQQMYISAHTVEWHLRKVFVKLGIKSRREIGRHLPHEDIS